MTKFFDICIFMDLVAKVDKLFLKLKFNFFSFF